MKLRTRLAAFVAAAASAVTIGTVTLAPAAHAAPVVAASSHTRLWWDGATCRAFAAHQLPAMVSDSRHADTYLRSDVGLWVHDHRRHASAHTVKLDRGYVALDCAGSYGL